MTYEHFDTTGDLYLFSDFMEDYTTEPLYEIEWSLEGPADMDDYEVQQAMIEGRL